MSISSKSTRITSRCWLEIITESNVTGNGPVDDVNFNLLNNARLNVHYFLRLGSVVSFIIRCWLHQFRINCFGFGISTSSQRFRFANEEERDQLILFFSWYLFFILVFAKCQIFQRFVGIERCFNNGSHLRNRERERANRWTSVSKCGRKTTKKLPTISLDFRLKFS